MHPWYAAGIPSPDQVIVEATAPPVLYAWIPPVKATEVPEPSTLLTSGIIIILLFLYCIIKRRQMRDEKERRELQRIAEEAGYGKGVPIVEYKGLYIPKPLAEQWREEERN
jgi:hypothetical protein